MKTKLSSLALSTALALVLASPALADSNSVYLDQSGDNNSASVSQTGGNNRLGVSSPAGRRALQSGNNNTILATQSSTIGFTPTPQGASLGVNYDGLNQTGNYNRIEATQQSGTVEEIQQTSTAATGTVTGTTNLFKVDQKFSSSNTMMFVRQIFTGAWVAGSENSIDAKQATPTPLQTGSKIDLLFQSGQYNTIETDQQSGSTKIGEINQNGVNNLADVTQNGTSNVVNEIDQDGANNQALVTQTGGTGNKVDLIEQNSTPSFAGNYASVIMTGSSNGTGLLTGPALVGGVTSSQITQLGGNNSASLDFTGSGNEFGIYQTGTDNTVGTLTITGNDNEIGVFQDGTANVVSIGVVAGSNNRLGVSQDGTNTATLNILGGTSNGNDVLITQDDTNVASVNITGSNNVLDILQDGDNNGPGQGVTVTINGSGNNNASAGSFSAPLFTAALTASGLGAGDIVQLGNDNAINIQVGNVTPGSDNNLFAFKQNGNNNSLTGTINGDANQALVYQNGNSNITNFTQNGGGNYAVVTQ